MSIENPISYAEWYWKNSVDAVNLRAEEIEKSLSPVLGAITDGFIDVEGVPEEVVNLLTILKTPEQPSWDENLVGYATAVLSKVTDFAFNGKLRDLDYGLNDKLQNLIMSPEVANTLFIRKKVAEDFWESRLRFAGYSPDEAQLFYEAQKPYPAMPDLISWARYSGDPTNPESLVRDHFDISSVDWPIWEWLSRMKLNTDQVLSLYKRGTLTTTEADLELQRIGWQDLDVFYQKALAHSIPNAMLMVQGNLIQGISGEQMLDDISIADIHPQYAQKYLDAVLTKPASIDLVRYALRQDPSLSQLGPELQKIGIHPNYTDVYKELAYEIPPVQDIITMAVREAFTPSIASRFGQYEDLPPDFVEWSQKKGLTKDWAERYWAAHWSLPSPQQGFEMLHRGVIGQDDLHLLLRASDVMPFWRDKLIQIAYRPLSRVDVRRMFALGVIDVNGVRKAYTDLGYDSNNADLMTRFTVEYTKGAPRKLSTAAIVTAYQNHLIESSELREQLYEAGTDEDDVEPIVKTAQKKREWSDTQDEIAVIEYSFKKGKTDETTTINALRDVGQTNEHAKQLIDQWRIKSVEEKDNLWTTAQTLGFMKKNLITIERGKQELQDLGFDEEHINVYVASLTPAP